ncbi:MAG: hypothetical protein ACQERJ_06825 [Bacillota bacterium]
MKGTRIILILICVGLVITACSSAPSDETLINNFKENKSDFEKLIAMFKADQELEYISHNMISPHGSIGEPRKEKYIALFKKLNLEQMKSDDKKDDISISAYAAGLGISGSAKGYEYWGQPLPAHLEVVENLDQAYQQERAKGEPLAFYKFRHLEGKWYLYYSVDD